MGKSLQNSADSYWLGRILKSFDGELLAAKNIAEWTDHDRSTVYTWLNGDAAPSIELLPLIYRKFPVPVVDAINSYLESQRPARAELDDDINGDGRIDQQDVHAYLLRVAQLDLKAIEDLSKQCAGGECDREGARIVLEEINKVLPALAGAQRTLNFIINRNPRRAAAGALSR